MKEYIELKAAVELAMQYCPDDDGTCSKADRDIRELLDELENLPSIQLDMPLIRCKDCIWMQCNAKPDGTLPKGVDEYECRHWCGACDPTDFCSYGERKEREA